MPQRDTPKQHWNDIGRLVGPRSVDFSTRGVRALFRTTVLALLVPACTVVLPSCSQKPAATATAPRVVVLGFDGVDPRLCERMMDKGELPNLAKMRAIGGFKPLGTTMPPQSPVAWASFITGANPGVTGIFDFVHRDPKKQCAPYYSAAETVPGDPGWDVGKFNLPLTFWPFDQTPTRTVLMRDGTPFWNYLDAAGIPTQIYDIPADYPPSKSKYGHVRSLAGMGVPDLRGTYGTYQYFSELVITRQDVAGGVHRPLVFRDNKARTLLEGPDNGALKTPERVTVPMVIYRHPTKPSARIDIQGKSIVLNEGDWSDWVQVDFKLDMPPFLPSAHASGICRFYLKEVHPNFSLYVSPINIDPSDPGDQRLTEPPEMLTDMYHALGFFYTTGFQEEHNALSNKVFTDAEYKVQAEDVLSERLNLLDYATAHYDDGLLFFYFSSTDQIAHMFWWDSDAKHPVRTPENAKKYNNVIIDVYKRMDQIVGQAVERYGDKATILVMSDHGFCNFRRQVNLNTWLRDNGYLNPPDARCLMQPCNGQMVDWTQTRAYGLGLNGLYLNLEGREREGIVRPDQRDMLLTEISEKLLKLRDPEDGAPVIKAVHRADQIYSGPEVYKAPDLLVGYYRGYRASWATTMGGMPDKLITDNDTAWSADHCIDNSEVPGVIFANRPITRVNPTLIDLAPTILKLFNVDVPKDLKGGSLFEGESTASASPMTKE